MSTYSWLVFDADGTLFDYDAAEMSAFTATLEHFELPFSVDVHEIYTTINGRLWTEFEQGLVTSERLRVQRFEEFVTEIDAPVDAARMSRAYLETLGDQTQLLPGAREVVEDLAGDFNLVLATNGIAEVQHSRIAKSPLADFFPVLVISDEVGAAKPDPRFFDALVAAIASPRKTEILMIGDGLNSDIAGAAAYGIDTCWFNAGGLVNDSGVTPTFEIATLDRIGGLARNASGIRLETDTPRTAR